MSVTVADIMAIMNRLAPPELMEEWDNCGLQAGSPGQRVEKIMVALDPSFAVVSEACRGGFDLLITHHPLFIKAPRPIDFSIMPGRAIAMAAKYGLSIFSAHTNLDSAEGGLNDMCADLLGLKRTRVLSPRPQPDYVKLVFFVPVDHERELLDVLSRTSAGTLGNYASCSFSVRGVGRFKPLEGSSPHIGETGKIASVNETRVEAIVARRDLPDVVDALKSRHPYETMAYDVFPLAGGIENRHGLGRIGDLEQKMTLGMFAKYAMERFEINSARVAGDLEMTVRKVALCSGSGSGLLDDFMASGADVYLSGDLKYHDGMAVIEAGRGLVDIGHFETERLVVDLIAGKLGRIVDDKGLDVTISRYAGETNPFVNLKGR
ncbi:MAG: Nif3-like dinuclear metal center hexameric protein [Desulfococcus sp. 4484_241]|nr:MAG: Nif3-like dinuclear metal center hexameric protein [Desulfococcus sp. 4484_241]